jgi:hypothetical protein
MYITGFISIMIYALTVYMMSIPREQQLDIIIEWFIFPCMLETKFYMYLYSCQLANQFPLETELYYIRNYHQELQEHVAITYIEVWEKSLVTSRTMPNYLQKPNSIQHVAYPENNSINNEINFYKKSCIQLDDQLVIYNDYLNN